MDTRSTIFREIHKNTWLKRLTFDNKKITVGTKKSDRTWVVFCVHDDTEAILEGYIEPRQAAFHTPEWTVPLQTTLHISHALVPNESEYEFVITLASDVIRFNASSWEIMQEWVETLRQKLREMKILSPKENLYSKLPELRPPLLPTRDPTSPLPAPPPVPAALVPGIEQIIPATIANTINTQQTTPSPLCNELILTTTTASTSSMSLNQSINNPISPSSLIGTSTITTTTTIVTATSTTTTTLPFIPTTAMSNTLTQNLINMLSNPVSAYSSHVNNDNASDSSDQSVSDECFLLSDTKSFVNEKCLKRNNFSGFSLAKTFSNNVLADPNTCPSTSGLSNYVDNKDNAVMLHETDTETSSIDSNSCVMFQTEPLIIPRPQTTINSARSKRTAPITPQSLIKQIPVTQQSQLVADRMTTNEINDLENSSSITNITIIQVPSPSSLTTKQSSSSHSTQQKSIFNFPTITGSTVQTVELADDNFKSNVQIIPSNYSPPTPLTPSSPVSVSTGGKSMNSIKTNNDQQNRAAIVVQVPCSGNGSGAATVTGYEQLIRQSSFVDTTVEQYDSRKIKNFGPVTNIPIGTTTSNSTPTAHYEQVFNSSIASTSSRLNNNNANNSLESQLNHQQSTSSTPTSPKIVPNKKKQTSKNPSQSELYINRINLPRDKVVVANVSDINTIVPSTSVTTTTVSAAQTHVLQNITNNDSNNANSNISNSSNSNNGGKKNVINNDNSKRENLPSALPAIRQFLQRGLTEVAIIRPSRKDSINPLHRSGRYNKNLNSNKSDSQPDIVQQQQQQHQQQLPQQHQVNREQRRRSSSTSDAHGARFRSHGNNVNGPSLPGPEISRLVQPTLTLREQQVLQLRREMMHPGGVRIQLRRKDCTGSIALVDAFGAVWITGWKQKEHPILYNALHIGDQLVSIGGVSINTATDVHRTIRNTPGSYIEFIIRRIPFGRVYAIRREIDGQCLGLIRDGNTATIIDVIPNSLAARHGLPPKAQSCDGLSLTFWVLTEINGRPLNLFFKDNEVRDRLNAVGRDLSILVQPSDLITKLKKQLKSLRGYKDYIVQ